MMIYKELPRFYNGSYVFIFLMRVALQFAYDGQGFHGFARQPGLRTIEGELISNLISEGFIEDVRTSQFRSSSRTDKGVSALCNVVAFNTTISKQKIVSIRTCSTNDIIIYGYALVDDSFYPRYATLRMYRYFLPRKVIDEDILLKTLGLFTGEHDFTNFARIETGKNPIRLIENIIIGSDEECFMIDFYAQNFLWNQIRRIISSILQISKNKINHQDIINALNNPSIQVDFGVAPPEPLVLKDIVFKDVKFHRFLEQKRSLSDLEKRIRDQSIDLFS